MTEFEVVVILLVVVSTALSIGLVITLKARMSKTLALSLKHSIEADLKDSPFSNVTSDTLRNDPFGDGNGFEEEVISREKNSYEATRRLLDRSGTPEDNVIHIREWLE